MYRLHVAIQTCVWSQSECVCLRIYKHVSKQHCSYICVQFQNVGKNDVSLNVSDLICENVNDLTSFQSIDASTTTTTI